ncbi:HAMP domain-containing histidine kinase [Oscillatoria sp. FACHB-1407]|uniref:sensor histidine kinase n=1 Tax=Oscillatoria sp. FACHB-1407 TaxID=2692847 RepID=UPI001684D6E9|nr:HAMP domain-containing sensor histidine kinase [Oscillatoria sp. FACHB-1407]MBD2461054.1 HAMP domain-containing histidine kinase [Oscillatoria sp. FACHB-1407]
MVWQKANLGIQYCLSRFEQLKPPFESADYRAWKLRFLRDRLKLCLWLAFICLLTFIVRDIYDAVYPMQEMADLPQEFKRLFPLVNGVMAVSLLSCLVLLRTRWGKRHPNVIFLSLSWSITLVPQIIMTLWGYPCPEVLSWSLVFLTQATLIPVRWWLHLVSQVGAIAYYLTVYPLLGLTTTVEGDPIYSSSIFLYLFWFCLICDLAVFLYERLQRTEFESQRELQVFLNTVTHDLRTPVMGASMVLQSLLKTPDERITVNRYMLERMLQGSDRQMSLLNSLLEAHSCEVHSFLLQREAVQLNQLLQNTLAEMEPLLTKNEVTLTNKIRDDLPAIQVDPVQIARVFNNLISNAIKHNPPGIQLTLDARVDGKSLRCSVQDNGVGMTFQQSRQLFDLYVKGRRARYLPGLGLGLHLCKQIITAHGGRIGVTSAPNAGANFWFTLPLVSKSSDRLLINQNSSAHFPPSI